MMPEILRRLSPWHQGLAVVLAGTAIAAGLVVATAPRPAGASALVTGAIFPAVSCSEGSAKHNLSGAYISCNGVNDWWGVSEKPYTVVFGGYINPSTPMTGDLKFEEWGPYSKKPIFQYDFGKIHLSLTGEWFRVGARALRNKPGDYYAEIIFAGQPIGLTPVNVTRASAP
jgi:hypothetical protein